MEKLQCNNKYKLNWIFICFIKMIRFMDKIDPSNMNLPLSIYMFQINIAYYFVALINVTKVRAIVEIPLPMLIHAVTGNASFSGLWGTTISLPGKTLG